MNETRKLISICIALLFLFSCTQKEALETANLEKSAAPATGEQFHPLGYIAGDEETAAPPAKDKAARKVIQNGDITLSVKYYEPFYKALKKQLVAVSGYVAEIHITRGSDSVSSAEIRFRIPPDKVDPMISWLAEQGIVVSENVTAEDISEQYYDLKSRLENAKRFEARLLEMLRTQTGELTDVVLVEEKLNQVREQIETMEGRMRMYDNLVDLATFALHVKVEERYVAPHTPTFFERGTAAWHNSTAALKQTAQALTILAIMFTPWTLLLLVIGLIVRYVWLRRRLRHA